MSISSLGGLGYPNPFGILNSFAEPEPTDTAATSDATATTDTAAADATTTAPADSSAAAPVSTAAPSYTNLLDAVTQLGGGLGMTTGATSTAPTTASSDTSNSATNVDDNSPRAIQAKLHELFQKLANATAADGSATGVNGEGRQHVRGGHGHHGHHRQEAVASSDSGSTDSGSATTGQDPTALLHQVIAALGQFSEATGGAATTSSQTGASYDFMTQLQKAGGLLNIKAD